LPEKSCWSIAQKLSSRAIANDLKHRQIPALSQIILYLESFLIEISCIVLSSQPPIPDLG
jgi:hypothetical protein